MTAQAALKVNIPTERKGETVRRLCCFLRQMLGGVLTLASDSRDTELLGHAADTRRVGRRGETDNESHQVEEDDDGPLSGFGPVHGVYRVRKVQVSKLATPKNHGQAGMDAPSGSFSSNWTRMTFRLPSVCC